MPLNRARRRCHWARGGPDIAYHDREWGVPVRADRRLFELLLLEGAQAGLSWATVLARRSGYRAAFAAFDPTRVARFTKARAERLLRDSGIIRHRGKIESAITNAGAFLAVQREHGSFAAYLWSYVDGRPVQNRWRLPRDVPAQSSVSQTLSRDLKRRGFTFVGPTICYAFMQSTGLVNDHLTSCFRHKEVMHLAAAKGRESSAKGRTSLRSGRRQT